AQFRRLQSRLGPPKTITAMAAKLARLVYRMLKYGEEYVDKGEAQYEGNRSSRCSPSTPRNTVSPSFHW
ncbi:MAG: IS110 family transposase, partial [Acidobacteriota bacterium]